VDGSTIWTHQFGTSGNDASYGAFLSGGELYAVGATGGAFGDQVSAGSGDAFVQSIDAATGAKIWTHQFGTDRSDYAYADWVAGGAIYVVGGTRGTFEGFQKLGSGDAFVARIDLP
jgi:outer membrane protein assembly factor BamB